jgi:hypothetical protein
MDPYFHMLPFIIGIIVGYILLILYKDEKISIIDYPKPFDNKVYVDKNNVKFQYITKEVDCDKNEATLKSYPIQS